MQFRCFRVVLITKYRVKSAFLTNVRRLQIMKMVISNRAALLAFLLIFSLFGSGGCLVNSASDDDDDNNDDTAVNDDDDDNDAVDDDDDDNDDIEFADPATFIPSECLADELDGSFTAACGSLFPETDCPADERKFAIDVTFENGWPTVVDGFSCGPVQTWFTHPDGDQRAHLEPSRNSCEQYYYCGDCQFFLKVDIFNDDLWTLMGVSSEIPDCLIYAGVPYTLGEYGSGSSGDCGTTLPCCSTCSIECDYCGTNMDCFSTCYGNCTSCCQSCPY
jgi:hypothetical protein